MFPFHPCIPSPRPHKHLCSHVLQQSQLLPIPLPHLPNHILAVGPEESP